jgi:DNA-directed RNA polymerase specialized sigma24 family protein
LATPQSSFQPSRQEIVNALLPLREALEKLERESPEMAELVKLRYFAGFSHQEAAPAPGIFRTTADRSLFGLGQGVPSEMEDRDQSRQNLGRREAKGR